MKHTKVHTPRGVQDILPPDAARKARIEGLAAERLEQWGYARVVTPTFEYYDALTQGEGPQEAENLYRLVDRDGATLVLRPEMTTPIARLVATRYQASDLPLRFYYIGSVFRYDEPQAGRQREFTQIGVELLGAEGPMADAEVIALAIALVDSLGLASFRVDIGHSGYVQGLLEPLGDKETAFALRRALLGRDYVEYERLVAASGISGGLREALLALPTLRGGAEVLARAKSLAAGAPEAAAAIDNLEHILRLAEGLGLGDRLAIDLGMVKDVDYYTGVLLEGYTPELGFTLCSGGRYDALVGRFGLDCPAVGFALGVERAMLVLDRQGAWGRHAPADVLLLGGEEAPHERFRLAEVLRARGIRVELDVSRLSWEAAIARAERLGIERVAALSGERNGEPLIEVSVPGGERRRGTVQEIWG